MARRQAPQAGTPATVALAAAQVPHTLHHYAHAEGNTHFGDEATEALGLDPHRVFKTLLVSCQAGAPLLAVAVLPVANQLDLKAMAAAVGAKKAALADPAETERVTGYVVGGISPLGQRRRLPCVLDDSARAFDTIFVSAGRRGLQVELAPDDLLRLAGASYDSIAR